MYAVDSPDPTFVRGAVRIDAEDRIAMILAFRERVLESRDLLYASPGIRRLIEDDIPELVAIIREQRRHRPGW